MCYIISILLASDHDWTSPNKSRGKNHEQVPYKDAKAHIPDQKVNAKCIKKTLNKINKSEETSKVEEKSIENPFNQSFQSANQSR